MGIVESLRARKVLFYRWHCNSVTIRCFVLLLALGVCASAGVRSIGGIAGVLLSLTCASAMEPL